MISNLRLGAAISRSCLRSLGIQQVENRGHGKLWSLHLQEEERHGLHGKLSWRPPLLLGERVLMAQTSIKLEWVIGFFSDRPVPYITENRSVVGCYRSHSVEAAYGTIKKMNLRMEGVSGNITEIFSKFSRLNRKDNEVRWNSRILKDWKVKSYFGHVKLNTNFSGRSVSILEE